MEDKKEKIILLNKDFGITPLQAIENFRSENPSYKDSKIGYAGRLDPMASGLLILMIDEECLNRDKYQGLDKEYEFEVVFGIHTDTLDIMGMIDQISESKEPQPTELNNLLKEMHGEFEMKYPAYSSFSVNGKPLYWYAKNDKLNEIEIPTKKVNIFSLKLLGDRMIEGKEFIDFLETYTKDLKGDFRVNEIISDWKEKVDVSSTYYTIKLVAHVSSGTYIRSIADIIGEKLNMPTFAYKITRTKVGEFTSI